MNVSMIMCHKNPVQVIRLVERIHTSNMDIVIHPDTSGTYGTFEHLIHSRLSDEFSEDDSVKAKKRYIIDRVFLRGERLNNKYPFFYKYKILLPVLDVYRIVSTLFKRSKRTLIELKRIRNFKNQ